MKLLQITYLPIITAIITGIIGPILVLQIKYLLEQKKYPKPPNRRLNSIMGSTWQGTFKQLDPKDNTKIIEQRLDVQFSKKGRKINGEASFISIRNEKAIFSIMNGKFDGNILKIEYENKNREIFQTGSMVFKLNDYGDELTGKFVVYSPASNSIISGEAIVTNK